MKGFKFLILIPMLIVAQVALSQSNFEGKVTYEISYEPIHPNATVEFLEDNYGVKEIFYYKKGHYKRVKLNRSNDTVSVVIFNPKTKTIHGSHISMRDTIMAYTSKDNVMESFTSKREENISIEGNDTYGMKYSFVYKPDNMSGGSGTSEMIYYFSKTHPIKARWHKNQQDEFYDVIIRDNPYLILKVINDDKWIKVETKTAVQIEPMDIDKSVFEVDKSKPIKEL